MSKVELPPQIERQLKEVAKMNPRGPAAKKIFIGITNMCQVNTGLVVKLFAWANQRKFEPWFHFMTEVRHTDTARNRLADEFLKSGCDYLLMIDDDVDPHPATLNMADYDKEIVAGNIHCWIRGEIMPSIWQRAECEQCRVARVFNEKGEVHDKLQYKLAQQDNEMLLKWDPFYCSYEPFMQRHSVIPVDGCRCGGTGFDPFVFRTHQQVIGNAQLMEVDSVGSAAMMIARRTFAKLKPPYFRFLYKESGDILLTEDHYFCWRAKEAGIKIWADPQMVGSHFKTVDLMQVNSAMINAFNKGMEYQKRLDLAANSVMIPPNEG